MIMISMHILKIYTDASPGLLEYSFEERIYPKFYISNTTLLLIDLNGIISLDFVWSYVAKGFDNLAIYCKKTSKVNNRRS